MFHFRDIQEDDHFVNIKPHEYVCYMHFTHKIMKRLIESNTTLREGRGNPIQVSKICNPRRGLPSHGCWKSWTRGLAGFRSPSLNVAIDYFSHSWLKMCKISLKRTFDATFLGCLALTFCDVISELLPEWACVTLQGGTTFLPTSKLADIPVSRLRKRSLTNIKCCN